MNGRKLVPFLSCCVGACSLPAFAGVTVEEADPRQYFSPMFHYVELDEERELGSKGLGGGVAYGREVAEQWWWETEFAAYGLDSGEEFMSDFYQGALTTGLMYAFGDRLSFTPFVVGAVGLIRNDVVPDDDDDYTLHANVGLGVITAPIFDNGVKLRAEARYMYDDYDGTSFNNTKGDGGFNDLRFSLGLEIPLGYTKVREVEKVVEKVVYETREVMVQEPDSDGDSIPDSRDECPDTLKGGEVDGKGCLLTDQTITFHNIGFEVNSDQVTASTRPVLERVAKALNAQTNFSIEITGHTDSMGSAEYNQQLSQARAESVRQMLIDNGVAGDRLTARGYGELDPVASNETASGRAMNRRVEFRVMEVRK